MTLLGAELRKLRRRPASYVVSIILIVLLLLFYLLIGATASALDPSSAAGFELLLGFPQAYSFVGSFILGLGGLLAVTYGAAVSGAEWSWGTIRVVIARGEGRTRYIVVQFAALAIALAVMVLFAFFAGTLAALLAASMGGVSTEGAFEADALLSLPELLARTWMGVLLHAAVGFAVASMLRSQLAGIGAGIALYVFEVVIGSLAPILDADFARYLPFSVAGRVVGGEAEAFGQFDLLDPTVALVLAGVYLVVALAIASLATERAEITA